MTRRYCEGEHRWYPLNEDKDGCERCDARRAAVKVQKKDGGHVAMQVDGQVQVHVFSGDADFLRDADRRYFVIAEPVEQTVRRILNDPDTLPLDAMRIHGAWRASGG